MRRLVDILAAIFLLLVLWPIILLIAALILVMDGRPVLYRAERMKTPDHGFLLCKFRTMRHVQGDSGVSGGDKATRISPLGAVLRAKRLDELPQLWNILRGDMGFVGPRPPLRRYVELYPDLYQRVLADKPGATGLATLVFHKAEERLLSPCDTPQATEEVYCRRCIPRKARLDLMYARQRTLCSDLRLMFATVFRKIPIRSGGHR